MTGTKGKPGTIQVVELRRQIRYLLPWRTIQQVEFATLEWIDWFKNRKLLEPICCVPPAEFEEMYYRTQHTPAIMAGLM